MPRRLRFAPPGYWLHLTQRGNNQQPVFSTGADRQRFRKNLATAGCGTASVCPATSSLTSASSSRP